MQHVHHQFDATALVIEWHVLGMFAPAFFTGSLIRWWGVVRVIVIGALLMLVCAIINLAGVSLAHFWTALLLLGVGWNFMFVGGTALLSAASGEQEKSLIQGANEVFVYAANAIASLLAGFLLHRIGWQAMNQVSLPFLLLVVVLCVLLVKKNRKDSQLPPRE